MGARVPSLSLFLPLAAAAALTDLGHRTTADLGGKSVLFETGRMAKLADGSCLVSLEGTTVLATVVSEPVMQEKSAGHVPLTVDYREPLYAVGRIPGTYTRREGAPGHREVLAARAIDRAIRPLFPPGYLFETQIICHVLSSDGATDPAVLCIGAASAALSVSDVPWDGAVGACRMGRVGGRLIVNPSEEEAQRSDLHLTYAGTGDGRCLMVEAEGREVPEADLLAALEAASSAVLGTIAAQESLASAAGSRKREGRAAGAGRGEAEGVRTVASRAAELEDGMLREALLDASAADNDKAGRAAAMGRVRRYVRRLLAGEGFNPSHAEMEEAFHPLERAAVRTLAFDADTRCDGRAIRELRPLRADAGVLPVVHGSALFDRGDTQGLAVATIGSAEDAARADHSPWSAPRSLMVHYAFPAYCTNSTGKAGHVGSSRREVGHGALAEKALLGVYPGADRFPFAVRVSCETLGSSGSSSMAAVCAGSLAMADAGVPIARHAAGVSVGLVSRPTDPARPPPPVRGGGEGAAWEGMEYRLLTDIQGMEDHLGDMDLKVAGTSEGVTAVQLDLKVPGLPLGVLREALERARAAREKILAVMEGALARPRGQPRDSAPRAGAVEVARTTIGRLIGPGGATLRGIEERTGAKITVGGGGQVTVFAPNRAAYEGAVAEVELVETGGVEVDGVYRARVVQVMEVGAFVELPSGTQGLLHMSDMDHFRLKSADEAVKVGDEFEVKVVERDNRGNYRVSRRALMPMPDGGGGASASRNDPPPRGGGGAGGRKGGRGGGGGRGKGG